MEAWQISYRMIRDRGWINRRVERLTLMGADTARRQVSLDLSLPEAAEGIVCAPIAVMGKEYGILGDLDLRDEGGASIPLLTRAQARELCRPMLEAAACEALGEELSAEISEVIEGLLAEELISADEVERRLATGDGELAVLRDHGPFIDLATTLADHYFLFIPLDTATGRRRVIKYGFTRALSVDHPIDRPAWAQRLRTALGWRPMALRIELPAGADRNPAPYYLTLAVPDGLALTPLTPAARRRSWFDDRSWLVRSHVDLDCRLPTQQLSEGKAIARLEKIEGTVETGVRLGQSKLLSGPVGLALMVALGVLALVAALSESAGRLAGGADGGELGAAAGFLFAIPGLFAGYLAVSNENSLLSHLLAGVRAAMAVTALAAGGAAMALVLSPPSEVLKRDQLDLPLPEKA